MIQVGSVHDITEDTFRDVIGHELYDYLDEIEKERNDPKQYMQARYVC